MYRYFDLILDCAAGLPELPAAAAAEADVQIEVLPPRAQEPRTDWFHHWYADRDRTQLVVSAAREPDGFRLRYPGLADFRVSAALDRLRCVPAPGVPGHTLRHLLLDGALPHVLGQRGDMILHASAVRSPQGRGLAFVGDSGWGKSTLASACFKRGYALVADDCLKLVVHGQQLLGLTSYPGARLWPDSREQLFPDSPAAGPVTHYSSKQRLELSAFTEVGPLEIHDVFLLEEPVADAAAEPAPVRLASRASARAVTELIARCFMLDIEDQQAVSRLFRTACAVHAACPRIWSLGYRRDYGVLEAVLEAVADPDQFLAGAKGKVP